MIFDIKSPLKFSFYVSRPGPFCLVFYQDTNENKKLYIHLMNILRYFPDLPFLRFDFDYFKKLNSNSKLVSANQILILENGKEDRVCETGDYSKIPKLLLNIRKILLEKKKARNMDYKRRTAIKRWTPQSYKWRRRDFIKFEIQDPEDMYPFPNETAYDPKSSHVQSLRIAKKYSKNAVIKEINIQSEISPPENYEFKSMATVIRGKPYPMFINHNINNNENYKNVNITKLPPNLSVSIYHNNQPLDLSLPKYPREKISTHTSSDQQFDQISNSQKIYIDPHFSSVKSSIFYSGGLEKVMNSKVNKNLSQ